MSVEPNHQLLHLVIGGELKTDDLPLTTLVAGLRYGGSHR